MSSCARAVCSLRKSFDAASFAAFTFHSDKRLYLIATFFDSSKRASAVAYAASVAFPAPAIFAESGCFQSNRFSAKRLLFHRWQWGCRMLRSTLPDKHQ